MDQAVGLMMAIGPAAEVLRLSGDRVDEILPTIEAKLYEGLEEFVTEDGSVVAPSSTWLVTGRAPG